MKKKEILTAFMENERAAMEEGRRDSSWYVMNWSLLKKDVVAAAPEYLTREELLRFYALLLRKGLLFDEPVRAHYPEWEEAYRIHTPWMEKRRSFGASLIGRLSGLCLFGFDYALNIGKNDGYEDYLLYLQAFRVHADNMPRMLKKGEKLLPFTDDEKVIQRASAALTGLEFIVDDWWRVTDSEEKYSCVNLVFFMSCSCSI